MTPDGVRLRYRALARRGAPLARHDLPPARAVGGDREIFRDGRRPPPARLRGRDLRLARAGRLRPAPPQSDEGPRRFVRRIRSRSRRFRPAGAPARLPAAALRACPFDGWPAALRAATTIARASSAWFWSARWSGFGPSRPPPSVACRIAAAMTAIGLGEIAAHGQARETIVTMPFERNRLTGDARRFARNRAIAEKLPDLDRGADLRVALRRLPGDARRRRARLRTGDQGADADRHRRARTRGLDRRRGAAGVRDAHRRRQVVIAGAEHELLMERDSIREQFFAAFDAFIPGS
jgi:hypothetical protein